MNNRLAPLFAILGGALCLGVGAACQKTDGPSLETTQSASKLSGATNVFSALNQKDYAGAMAALAKVRESLATAEQQMEFMVLTREVRGKLTDASASDPKAAEALKAMRVMTGGR